MPIAEAVLEMEGKISLLDNKRFIFSLSLIGAYYIIYLGYLAHVILSTH